MRRSRLLGLSPLFLFILPAGLHAQIASIQRIVYGSPLVDSVPRSEFPRGGSYTAVVQGAGLSYVTGFTASDPRVSGSVSSVTDTSVTVQISTQPVDEGEMAIAPILGVSFALLRTPPPGQPPLGPISSGAVTFAIVVGPPPQVTSWKITNGVKWVPGGVATTVKYEAVVIGAGNIKLFYFGAGAGGNITSWTSTGDQFTTTWEMTIDLTVPIDFAWTNWGSIYGAVDGAGQGGTSTTSQSPLSPTEELDLPVVQMQLVDPVPTLLEGPSVTSDIGRLSTEGRVVSGVAADGAARLVLRIAGAPVSEEFVFALAADGALANVGSDSYSSSVTLQADSSGKAHLLFRAPDDFSPPNTIASAGDAFRNVDVNYTSPDNPGVVGVMQIKIVRPPVMLIHGIWGKPGNWDGFVGNLRSSLGGSGVPFKLFALAYNFPLPQITSTQPSLPASSLPSVQAANNISSLGFTFTGRLILPQINQYITAFKEDNNVAAIQADIVAHSMGGVITRTLPRFGGAYFDESTFRAGSVHKLITINTPHLGTPLAINLLSTGGTLGDNTCVRELFAIKGMLPAASVSLAGFASTVNGAVGDLQGDGFGGSLSGALSAIRSGAPTIATAFIAGNGCGTVDCDMTDTFARTAIQGWCGGIKRNPLGLALNPFDWPRLFRSLDSDAIVPLTSQSNQTGTATTFPVVHSPGTRLLGFVGPDALGDIRVAGRVIQLLNTPRTTAPTYIRLY